MENDVKGLNHNTHQDGRVQIVDLGADVSKEHPAHPVSHPARTDRRRNVGIGLVIAGLVGGISLIPSINGDSPSKDVSPLVKAPTACEAVEQVKQNEDGDRPGESNGSLAGEIQPGYSLFGVMTSRDTTELVGLVHPGGSVELCEESVRRSPVEIHFASEADLGELPKGMTYAYDSDSEFSDNILAMRLLGIRLSDGTVVKSLTFFDGRTVPATTEPK